MTRYLILLFLLTAVLVAATYVLTQDRGTGIQASTAVTEAMGSDTTGYRRATSVRDFSFPDDHGPHPGYKTEWWYYTGNLDTGEGRHFGYELTIFRIAMAPSDSARPTSREEVAEDTSSWATDQFYMAHFAVSDVQNESFHVFERFSRGAAGLAGAQSDPFRIWLEDWSVESTGASTFPVRVQAAENEVSIDLTLRPEKPLVLQGDRGLSQKGPGKGNASYYYSYTRLGTEGIIAVEGDTAQVEGLSWMDREWSTSALGNGQGGWDWFALQLSDGHDVMYYQIRNRDGTPSRYSEGVIVDPDGNTRRIPRGDIELEVLDTWASPRADSGTYPSKWHVRIPEAALDLTITPYFENQELDVSVRYWEGAVRIEGTVGGRPVSGRGYVEMTGYGDEPPVS